MEVALRRRLAGVAEIAISQASQTAAVTFAPGTLSFSASEFRRAIAEAEVTVLAIDVDVCGRVDAAGVLHLSSGEGAPTWPLRGSAPLTPGHVCLTGRLRDEVEPPYLDVAAMQPPT